MHVGSTFLSRLRMMLVGIWLGLYWACFLSSIITFKVPGRFGRQASVTDIYHAMPYQFSSVQNNTRSRPLVHLHRPLPCGLPPGRSNKLSSAGFE